MKLKKPLGIQLNAGPTVYMAKEVAYMLKIKPSAFSTYVHNKEIKGLKEHVYKEGRKTYYDKYAIQLICKERKEAVPDQVYLDSEKDLERLTQSLDYNNLGLTEEQIYDTILDINAEERADRDRMLFLLQDERKKLYKTIIDLKNENHLLRLKLDEQKELIKEYRIRFTRAMHSSEKVTNAVISLLKKWGAEGLKPRKEIVDEYFRSGVPELFEAEARLTDKAIDNLRFENDATSNNT